jgi:pilus assembly protein CpaE
MPSRYPEVDLCRAKVPVTHWGFEDMTSERVVLLFNADAASSVSLRAAINGLPDTKVITEVSDQASLFDALRRLTVNVVAFHLDPNPDDVIQMVETFAAQFPKIPIIAISQRTDPTTIINAMRAGCQQFVFEPIDRADLARAVDRVAIKHSQLAPTGRRICVVGGSGGVGATTIACNLALEIGHVTQQTCAIVDLQLELGDVASNFDCVPNHTIASLCEVEGEIDRTMLETAIVQLPCNVAVLGRPTNVEEAGVVTPDRAASILRLMSNYYGSIVVDTPRTLDRLTLGALEQADAVLLVLQLIVPSVRNATRLYRTLMNYGMPDERVHLVINRFKKNVGRIMPEDVEKQFGKKAFGIVPNDYQCVTNSLDFGHPLMADAPNSAVRTAIRELATQLIGESPGEGAGAKPGARKGSLLERIFGS